MKVYASNNEAYNNAILAFSLNQVVVASEEIDARTPVAPLELPVIVSPIVKSPEGIGKSKVVEDGTEDSSKK